MWGLLILCSCYIVPHMGLFMCFFNVFFFSKAPSKSLVRGTLQTFTISLSFRSLMCTSMWILSTRYQTVGKLTVGWFVSTERPHTLCITSASFFFAAVKVCHFPDAVTFQEDGNSIPRSTDIYSNPIYSSAHFSMITNKRTVVFNDNTSAERICTT